MHDAAAGSEYHNTHPTAQVIFILSLNIYPQTQSPEKIEFLPIYSRI